MHLIHSDVWNDGTVPVIMKYSAGPPRSIRGDTVSHKYVKGRSTSVMDKVSPTMSVTCTLKFAYSSLCVDGTITV